MDFSQKKLGSGVRGGKTTAHSLTCVACVGTVRLKLLLSTQDCGHLVCVCSGFMCLKRKTVLGDPRSVVVWLLLHHMENLLCKDACFFYLLPFKNIQDFTLKYLKPAYWSNKKKLHKIYGTWSGLSVIYHLFRVSLLEGGRGYFSACTLVVWLHAFYCMDDVLMHRNVTCDSQTLGPQVDKCHGLMNRDVSVTSSRVKLDRLEYFCACLVTKHPESIRRVK